MRTANYTDLRNNLKSYIDSVIENADTVIIHRSVGKGAVLISLDEYNAIKETEYIMSSPKMVKRYVSSSIFRVRKP
jgi:antitoxin YefM